MLGFFADVHPLIIDVVLVAILLLIVFFGIIRGIKKNFLDFIMLAAALFLGFCPYTQKLKEVIFSDLIKLVEFVPAGSSNTLIFAVSLFNEFIAALVLFLLIFLVMAVVRTLIVMMINRKRGDKGGKKSAVGRVFSGILSLAYGAVLLVATLHVLNNNIVGMNALVEQSTVAKMVAEESELLVNRLGKKIAKKENTTDRIVLKIYKGDFLYKVDDKMISAFDYVDGMIDQVLNGKKYLQVLEETTLTNEEAKEIAKERLVNLSNLAIISDNFDSNPIVKEKFAKLSEEWLTVLHRKIDGNHIGKVEFTMNDYGEIRLNLINAGLSDDLIKLFEEIAVGN